jgi:hypothetical protein
MSQRMTRGPPNYSVIMLHSFRILNYWAQIPGNRKDSVATTDIKMILMEIKNNSQIQMH